MEEFEHWYRRLAHVFASSFIIYYLLPDDGAIGLIKKISVIVIIFISIIFEIRRLKHKNYKISGLREYENYRVGSYIYFGMGSSILLLLFPQQISIPCIVATSLVDPLIGEMRRRNIYGAYFLSFFISFMIFFSVWITSSYSIIISLVSAFLLVISEAKKSLYLDDDLLMQIIPAIFMMLIYIVFGNSIMPRKIIVPIIGGSI